METQHPYKDPLGIVGRVLGYERDESRKFTVKVFSHPAVHSVKSPDKDEPDEVVGESYRYSVEMNFAKAGRKVVTCVVASTDMTDNEFSNDRLRTKVLKYLEHTSEEVQVAQVDDTRIPWDSNNSCA